MWKIITLRINYYTTEEVLVWVRHGAADLLELLPLLRASACTSRAYKDH